MVRSPWEGGPMRNKESRPRGPGRLDVVIACLRKSGNRFGKVDLFLGDGAVELAADVFEDAGQ